MTLADWLATRTPRPPAALCARMDAVLGNDLSQPAERAAALCLAAGERLSAELLRNNFTTRESALDLLTADALVTYAFEAAANAPDGVAALAADAMRRIAHLGADNEPSRSDESSRSAT